MTLKKYIHSNIELIVFFLLVSILAYLLIRRSWEGFFYRTRWY